MKRKRKKYPAEFKAKVALEDIKGKETVQQLEMAHRGHFKAQPLESRQKDGAGYSLTLSFERRWRRGERQGDGS